MTKIYYYKWVPNAGPSSLKRIFENCFYYKGYFWMLLYKNTVKSILWYFAPVTNGQLINVEKEYNFGPGMVL